jgi:hypothetical protein
MRDWFSFIARRAITTAITRAVTTSSPNGRASADEHALDNCRIPRQNKAGDCVCRVPDRVAPDPHPDDEVFGETTARPDEDELRAAVKEIYDLHAQLQYCYDHVHELRGRTADFIESVRHQTRDHPPSPKQAAWIISAYQQLQRRHTTTIK